MRSWREFHGKFGESLARSSSSFDENSQRPFRRKSLNLIAHCLPTSWRRAVLWLSLIVALLMVVGLVRVVYRSLLPGTLYCADVSSAVLSSVIIAAGTAVAAGYARWKYQTWAAIVVLLVGASAFFAYPYSMLLEYVSVSDEGFSFSSGIPLLSESASFQFEDVDRVERSTYVEESSRGVLRRRRRRTEHRQLAVHLRNGEVHVFERSSAMDKAYSDIFRRGLEMGVGSTLGFDQLLSNPELDDVRNQRKVVENQLMQILTRQQRPPPELMQQIQQLHEREKSLLRKLRKTQGAELLVEINAQSKKAE